MTYQIPQEVLDLRAIRIEANVVGHCNARCNHCNKGFHIHDKLVTDMTVEQMRKAVDLLIDQKIEVRRFTFCGGEPILHPDLQELLYEAARLNSMRRGHIRILTNDMPITKAKRDKIILPDNRFEWIANPLDDPTDYKSGKNDWKKRPNRRYHTPFWISPDDIGIHSEFQNCTVKGWCGVGLDAEGFSICGKAIMFAKLLGVEGVGKTDGDIFTHVNTPVEEICKHCPYGMKRVEPNGKVRTDKYLEKEIDKRFKAGELAELGVDEKGISPTWQKAFARFSQEGPPLIQLNVL